MTIGIPIIGCPDYLKLIEGRSAKLGRAIEDSQYLPESLRQLIKRSDPAQMPYRALDSTNPFLGKKVFVLSGAADKLVPWATSKEFVDNLEVGQQGTKRVFLQDGTGHKCTKEMVGLVVQFVSDL